MIKENLILLVVLSLFLITRLTNITSNPPSLYWDEASIGYNAYAVLTTGRDEWGEVLPLHFRAFGEFKLPVYIYTVAAFESLLGSSELAVRLPAVLFSLITVVITYLLAKRVTGQHSVGLMAAFILVSLPWFFMISRAGFEASAGLALFLVGIYLFLISMKRPSLIILASIALIGSIYSYNSFRIIAPPVFLGLLVLSLLWQRRENNRTHLWLLISMLLMVMAWVPIIRLMLVDAGAARLAAVGIFSHYSNFLNSLIDFSLNYTSHFSLDFLVKAGDGNLRHGVNGFGVLLWPQLLMVVLGMVEIIRRQRQMIWLLILILISLVPSAITTEAPHNLRSIAAVPFVAIVAAIGVSWLIRLGKVKWLSWVVVGVVLIFFGQYLVSFFVSYPQQTYRNWQYGYKQVFTKYQSEFSKYDSVVISDQDAQPYIFGLFYLQYDPIKFRQSVQYNPVDRWGVSTVKSFDQFVFMPVQPELLPKGRLLIFATPDEQLANLDIKEFVDGLVVYEYENK